MWDFFWHGLVRGFVVPVGNTAVNVHDGVSMRIQELGLDHCNIRDYGVDIVVFLWFKFYLSFFY